MLPGVFDLGPHCRSDSRNQRQTQSGKLLHVAQLNFNLTERLSLESFETYFIFKCFIKLKPIER